MSVPVAYEAVQLPRGNVVVQKPSNVIEAALASPAEATAFAEALNRWLESRPTPKTFLVYRDFEMPARTPTEFDLFQIIDGIYLADERLDILAESLRRDCADELARVAA